MTHVRICSLQYQLRPVTSFDQFRDQVTAVVETAADYGCQLVLFPEYFSVQLLTLGDVKRPMRQQVRELALYQPAYIDMMSDLARSTGVYIAAGTFPTVEEGRPGDVFNDAFLFSPSGEYGVQGKMHMTRFEREEWKVSPRERLKVFETSFGRLAITICYDVEFPEIARAAARQGASILLVPSCTDDRQGFLRVRYCAHARAIENQMYVVQSSTVGSIPMSPAVHFNYGQASILTPSDFQFSRDGILAEGMANLETAVIGDLDLSALDRNRSFGAVLPLDDSKRTAELVRELETVKL